MSETGFEAEVARILLKGAQEEINQKDLEIEKLLAEIQKEKDNTKLERFMWIVVTIALIDGYIFMNMASTMGPLAILILELIVLFVAAHRLGVQQVIQFLDTIINALPKFKG